MAITEIYSNFRNVASVTIANKPVQKGEMTTVLIVTAIGAIYWNTKDTQTSS
jgi:hypothetical protein